MKYIIRLLSAVVFIFFVLVVATAQLGKYAVKIFLR